ncbi:hypothetical protein Aspvir_002308 [Aspergillus viridinutans]|uniref:Uncharacterized protein n=1 Tax=Aspergillus viridinutans TaxID=75553 RepID=A0A9P3F9I7_ASPVI|nr:uncharacterized protein Aspvir_002308 [Aspergillus viridinutans]GIK06658.1 hypothetical protein Aspvir_002308 [Aspergillus viridinutans]
MSRLQHEGWPDSVGWKNKAALKKAASDTVGLTKEPLKATEPDKGTQFAKIIKEGASYLLRSVVTSGGEGRRQYELDLEQACAAFLKIAMNIRTLLMDLLLEEEKALYALGQEEMLSSEMERMTLVTAVHRAA